MGELDAIKQTETMRTAFDAANYYTKADYKLLDQDERKTLLAIIHNLSNPSQGIPLTDVQVTNLNAKIAQINNQSERRKIQIASQPKIFRIFQTRILGGVSTKKLQTEMRKRDLNYGKNTSIHEHRFTVQRSENFEKHVTKLWESVDAGNKVDIAKGACESRIYSYEGGKAIYKDMTPKDLSLKRTIEISFKKLLKSVRPTELLPGGVPESKGFSEKVSYDLDREFKFDLVPETNFINKPIGKGLQGDVGSLQIFLKPTEEELKEDPKAKYIEAKDFKPKIPPTKEEKIIFQKFIILDYLIGNLDRHEENWMLLLDKEGRIKKIGVIDNGNSFPERNPMGKDTNVLKNQYKWGEHPYSTYKFEQETVDFLQTITEEKLIDFLKSKKEELKGHPHAETFFSDQMIQNSLERLRVMKEVVNTNSTPKALSQIKTGKAIENCLMNRSSPSQAV